MGELTPSEVARLRGLIGRVDRDNWSGTVLAGGLPQVPQRAALPAADKDHAYLVLTIPDAAGANDHTYQCLRVATVWTWVQLD